MTKTKKKTRAKAKAKAKTKNSCTRCTVRKKTSYSVGRVHNLTNITAALGELRNDKDFTNVTLVSDDGQQVEVRKFFLQFVSSSPFLKNILKKNTSSQTLMYIRGVRSEHLISLVDFLYSGEANIDQESLDTFLDLAVELELKGLRKTPVNDKKQKICRETNEPEKESYQSLAKGNGNNTILDQSKAMNNDATVVTNKDNTRKKRSFGFK